jgi:glycosyltransferase involved in cell wall biosynthesis
MHYTVLIRTRNSEQTLPTVLDDLQGQSRPPSSYVFVDDHSEDRTLTMVPEGAVVHPYEGLEFNFAAALNQGLRHVATELVLIISSHTRLPNPRSIGYALDLLARDENIGAAYFSHETADDLSHELIDRNRFDGFNGLWNTCSLIRMKLLRERSFRPEVFSAEDQEWASWVFNRKGLFIARIRGSGMANQNPHWKSTDAKKLNEYTCIAYFAHRKLLGWRHLADVACRVARPTRRPMLQERYYHLRLLVRLIGCKFRQPVGESRYFDDRRVMQPAASAVASELTQHPKARSLASGSPS